MTVHGGGTKLIDLRKADPYLANNPLLAQEGVSNSIEIIVPNTEFDQLTERLERIEAKFDEVISGHTQISIEEPTDYYIKELVAWLKSAATEVRSGESRNAILQAVREFEKRARMGWHDGISGQVRLGENGEWNE